MHQRWRRRIYGGGGGSGISSGGGVGGGDTRYHHSPRPPPPISPLDEDTTAAATNTTVRRGTTAGAYITWDFETCAPGQWFAVAVMVAEYPSRRILRQYHCSLRLPWSAFEKGEYRNFWQQLPDLKFQLDLEAQHHQTKDELQLRICQFVRQAHRDFPLLAPICDNHALDLVLLNNMLVANSLPLMTTRNDGTSSPVLDTRSYRLGVLGTINGKAHDTVDTMHATIMGEALPPPHQSLGYWALQEKHHPLHDCARILDQHFKVLDLVQQYRRLNLHPARLFN